MTNYIEHKPVMAKQVAELLVSNEEGIYVMQLPVLAGT